MVFHVWGIEADYALNPAGVKPNRAALRQCREPKAKKSYDVECF
jgi:hypothetical protein